MEPLLLTPDYIDEHQLIPYCAEEIRRMVRRGEIHAQRNNGRRILIHRDDLEEFASQFRHTTPAGSHASNKEGVCRGKERKVSTKGRIQGTGGRRTQMAAETELGNLLGFR